MRRTFHLLRTLKAAVMVVVLGSTHARAEQTEADKLFEEGAALMKQNKFADACPKLEASNRLDPEIGGMLWLADCYERNNQTASAYRTYKDAQKMAIEKKDKQQRDKVAQKHLSSLEPHLAKLTILGPQDAHPTGLEVTRDGQKLAHEDLGLAVPLDPGFHVITAVAPGFKKWEQKVDVTGEGATVTLSVGPLEKEQSAAPPPPPDTSDPGLGFKIAGVVIGSVGLVSIGVGSALGLLAAGKLSDSNSNGHCDPTDHCDAAGLQLRQDATADALISTILFIGGGVALAAGITVFFLAPKKKKMGPTFAHVVPAIGHGFYGAAISGSF